MESSTNFFLLVVIYVECLVGFTVNMIMVVANFMKWKNLKSLQDCDKILSSLAISRGLGFLSFFIRNTLYHFFPWLKKSKIVIFTYYFQFMFIFYNSHWIATVLCVFYCVKIVTYNYKLFLFLKTRVPTMIPRLILASLLISLISSLPYAFYGYDLEPNNLSDGSIGNITGYELVTVPNYKNKIMIFALGSIPPFVILCATISLLIHFLLIHTRRMRSNGSHIQSPNLNSHFGALKSMSLFLLLQIMYFMCMNAYISGRFPNHQVPIVVILCSLQFLHSLYLIYTSSEVRKMFPSMCLGLIRRP